MADYAPIRFVHRIRPLSTIIQRLVYVLVAGGMGVWLWPAWEWSLLCGLVALGCLIFLGFTRSLTLLVDDDGLTIIKRPLMGLFGRDDFFASADIRRIRYRSDLFHHIQGSVDYDETRYFLDLITVQSGIVNLVTSSDTPLERTLGKRLAGALNVEYEECRP